MQSVRIAEREIGPDHPTFVVAEIGINHNGSLDIAKLLIDAAVAAGCDAVKFQKRSVEVVYSAEELARPRESPFGATNGDLKRGLEFGGDQYAAGCLAARAWRPAGLGVVRATGPRSGEEAGHRPGRDSSNQRARRSGHLAGFLDAG